MTALSEVYWIGGMPASGKSTVARRLAEQLDLPVYHLDIHEPEHLGQITTERQPNWWFSIHEKYLTFPTARLTEILLAECEERMAFVFKDVRNHQTVSLLAEGAAFLPGILQREGVQARRALFLILDPDARASRWESLRSATRTSVLSDYDDPEAAWATWMERDKLVSQVIAEQARAAGMGLLEIEAEASVDAVSSAVMEHFGVTS